MTANTKMTKLVYVRGVEGNSVYLNDHRIAGPKPWGGGKVIQEWEIEEKHIFDALNIESRLSHLSAVNEKLVEAAKGYLGNRCEPTDGYIVHQPEHCRQCRLRSALKLADEMGEK